MTRRAVLPSRLVTLSASGKTPFRAPDLIRGCASPCRRFALPLTGHDARLGGDVTRHVFIVEDSHLLLLADLPARYQWPQRLTDPSV